MGAEESKVESIFYAAMDRESAAESAAYLDRACAGNPELRSRVELLLGAQPKLGRFLENGGGGDTPTIDQPVVEQPGTMIGSYKLIEEIGEGGMGSVFMALQKEPVRRKVALKVIRPGMDSRQVVSRFEAERQALAVMDHPCIARVFDGGSTESGRPYFVMELVNGMPVTDYCDRYQFTTEQRLGLFGQVCQAVQHAHQKGIIHRDLKPSNILVTHLDGRAVPKVIDFGVAKAVSGHLTGDTMVTQFAQMIGTPLYMSPEQAELSGQDIDTRSDVYSLGVLLYELLTGTTPFDGQRMKEASYDELRRIIREEEPPRPSTRLSTRDAALDTVAEKHHTDPHTLSRQLSGELDWIVMKALEKDRTRRYESANELAKDVQCYLDDEAVEACPPSTAYRLRKAVRRHKTALTFAATVVLLLVLGLIGTTWQAVRATQAEEQERNQAEIADKQRQAAEANYLLAREAVKQMLTRVANEELAAIPEMTEVRLHLMRDARLFYDELIKLDPNDAQAYFERAEVRYRLAEPREEIAADYEKAIELAPRNAHFERRFSFFLRYKVGDAPEVLRHAQRAVELAPNNAGYLGWLAEIHSSQGEYDKAIALHERAVAVVPNSAGVYASRSATFRAMGNLEDALADARKAIELEPARSEGWIKLSGILVTMKNYDEALVAMDRAIEILGPKRGTGYLYHRRCGIHKALGDTSLALEDINRAIELVPRTGYFYATRAEFYMNQGRLEEALADWTASIQCDPTWSYTYKRRAEAHFNLGHYDEALADIAKAVELHPNDLSALFWIQPIQMATCPDERFRAGLLELADKAIELNPEGAMTYAVRGWLFAEFGQEEKALADLKRVFDVLPREDELNGDHFYVLANLCGHLAHRQEVIPHLAKMAGIQPHRTFVSYWLALAQLGAGQLDSYRDACRATLRKFQDTKTPGDSYWVAWTCLLGPDAVDDYGPVVRLAEQAVATDPDSEVYLNTLGAILYRAGRFEEAVQRLTQANKLIEDPDSKSKSSPTYTWYFLAMAHHKLGHDAEAEKWLDKAAEWTDKVVREHEEGTTTLAWNRRLTLKLFREEAGALLEKSGDKSPEEEGADGEEAPPEEKTEPAENAP